MRPPVRLILSVAALLVLASCSTDKTVAPGLSAPTAITGSPALAALVAPTTTDFVIPASGGHIAILGGMYNLDVPANAVCDPNARDSQAGYSAAAWDAPCTVATTDIAVHATVQWSHNRLWVDFSPALRFAPGQTVMLSTDVMAPIVTHYAGRNAKGHAIDNSNGRSRMWSILYAGAIGGAPVVDAANDASLVTRIDFATGRIARRVKHFSGYNITTGAECVVNPDDPFCVPA